MKQKETRILTAGVFRCCLHSLGQDLEKEVQMGDKMSCQYCHREFTLVKEQDTPIWLPDYKP